jgi:hypothetical protein
MNFVFPSWARIAIALALFAAGYWTRGSIEAREQLHEAKQQIKQDQRADETISEKLRNEARADAELGTIQRKKIEAAKRDPSYREYLDSELPAQSREFLRAAESIDPSADGAKPRLRSDHAHD